LPISRHKAQRTCLGCRQALDRDKLVRYVISPQREIVIDYRGRLPGRGAYTHVDASCILAAIKRRQFDRAFEGVARTPTAEELLDLLAVQIQERIMNLLGIARKSGNVISGSQRVIEALRASDQVAVVLIADDISAAIGDKVAAKAEEKGVSCIQLFGKDRMGQQIGKGERSVIALRVSTLSDTLKSELIRYKQIAGES
jgi:uncharacterized protein